jgi:hypothetical protein
VNGYPDVSGIGLNSGPVSSVLLGSQAQQSPAAGSDFTYTIPDAGGYYEIVAVRARLVTSAAVANRFVAIQVKDAAGTELWRAALDSAIVASKTVLFTFAPTTGSIDGGLTNTLVLNYPLPDGPYLPRWTINSVTTAIDTADQWSQVAVWYRAYYPGPLPAET